MEHSGDVCVLRGLEEQKNTLQQDKTKIATYPWMGLKTLLAYFVLIWGFLYHQASGKMKITLQRTGNGKSTNHLI